MPIVHVNGTALNVEDAGTGPPVLMIMGTGASGRAWGAHQVPALVDAGYRVVTFDNRGIAPSDDTPGFGLDDMIDDTAGLIEHLRLGPCAVVGTSLGARIAQELALRRPELVDRAVLMATRGRLDAMRELTDRADRDLRASGAALPPSYRAMVRALRNLSPRTLADDMVLADLVQLFEMSDEDAPGLRAQAALDLSENRLEAYRAITVPCRVVAFADDLLCPPHLCAEVADAVPDCDMTTVDGCGHYGYLERPDAVNAALLDFLAPARDRAAALTEVDR